MELAYRILQVTNTIETFHTPKHATTTQRATSCFADDVSGSQSGELISWSVSCAHLLFFTVLKVEACSFMLNSII